MSRRSAAWGALVLLVVATVVVLVVRSQPSRSPGARANRIEHQLACPVCEGQSVADSNAPESRAMRDKIGELIASGSSDAQIRAYFVAKYGERVVATPDNHGIGLVAWVVPAVALFIGLAGIVLALRRWSRTPRLAATPEDEAIVGAAREAASE
jgi:cytochrome c-type biogenesis protein CcmH